MKHPFDPEALHTLIGRQFTWQGERYTAIEILSHPLSLVAQKNISDPHIQTDVHGRARSMTQASIITIPVLSSDCEQLHADFLQIQHWTQDQGSA